MSTIKESYIQAELALAAYVNLAGGILDDVGVNALVEAGMTTLQANQFASKWTVVDQYNDPLTGVSATVFEEISTGEKALAVRGTQGLTDFVADLVILAGVPSALNPQYLALRLKVSEWLGDGTTLTPGFSVAGHSLGGYLAAGLVADFSASISNAYLYNAPGNNSPISQVMADMGIVSTLDSSKIITLQADAGISPIAGLGNSFSPPLLVSIENQLDFSLIGSAPLALNHSQQVLTDSLAVYNLFATLDTNLNANGITDVSDFIKASTATNAESLEATVDMLGSIFGVAGNVATVGDSASLRNSLYTQIQAIQASALFESSIGVVSIVDTSSLSRFDQSNTVEGYAYRYALVNLTPFAISGNAGLYLSSEWGVESFTEQYLDDRAHMLDRLIEANTADVDYVPQVDGQSEYFYDYAADTEVLDTDFSSVFRTGPLIDSPELRAAAINTIFGDANDNTFAGGDLADSLYGGAGNDTLTGNGGDDYIEGGIGDDTYQVHQGRRAINYCSA